MSKILILVSKTGRKLFSTRISNHLEKDTEVVLRDYSDVVITSTENKLTLTMAGEDTSNFDLVFIRTSGKYLELAGTIAQVLQYTGTKFFDKMYANMGMRGTKFSALATLSNEGLPLPKTIYLGNVTYQNNFEELSRELGTPFIAKDISRQRGVGVHLIENQRDLENLSSDNIYVGQYMFQKLVHKKHEYRVLVLGDKVGVWEEKINTDKSEFRNNVALGAKEVFLPLKDIPEEISTLAISAARARGMQIAGVDIMIEENTGKLYLIEVNRGPGITYDESVSPELKAIAHFLEKESKNK